MRGNSHTIAINSLRATIGSVGVSWGVLCHEDDCRANIIGFRGETNALKGGMAHLIWHINGKPECRDCGAWLSYRSSKRCRKGTCEVDR